MSTCVEPGCPRRCMTPYTLCVKHRPYVRKDYPKTKEQIAESNRRHRDKVRRQRIATLAGREIL